jgi:HK97 family phage major capsid protein
MMDLQTARGILSRRDDIEDRAQSILDRAARSNRNLLASESREFEKLSEELRSANREAETIPDRLRAAVRDAAVNESRDALGVPRDFGAPIMNARSTFDEFTEMIRENREGHVDLNIGAMLAGKRTRRDGSIEHRDILTSTTGAPVPITTASSVYEYLVSGSGLLRTSATIMNTNGGESFRMPRVSAYSLGTAVAEASAIPESDPTLAMVEFKAYKYGAITEWSREIQEDTNVTLGDYIARNLGVAVSEAFSPVLINGAGTAGPQGILNGSPAGTVTGGTGVAGVPTFDNIIDLVYSVDAPYQAQGAAFIMHPTTASSLAKIKDTTGRSILLPSASMDVPSTILGFPVVTDAAMPTTGTSKKSVMFANFARYCAIRFAGPLRVEISYDARFQDDIVQCKAVQRLDSRVIDPNAAAVFVGGAS